MELGIQSSASNATVSLGKYIEETKGFSSTLVDLIQLGDLPTLEKRLSSGKTREEHQGEQHNELTSSNITGTAFLAFAAMCVVELTEALDVKSIAVVLPVSRVP